MVQKYAVPYVEAMQCEHKVNLAYMDNSLLGMVQNHAAPSAHVVQCEREGCLLWKGNSALEANEALRYNLRHRA